MPAKRLSINKMLVNSPIRLLLCTLMMSNIAHGEISREYVLKAGFILNFARYTSNLIPTEAPKLVICSSDASFLQSAQETLPNYKVQDKGIVVKAALPENYKTEACHIVFVSRIDQLLWQNSLEASANDKILFVGEDRNFLKQGGHIRFLISESKVRFEIATKRLKESKLKLSSKVIRLGFVYEGKQT